ncbi:MAG: hypothetical protein H6736_15950 [Alphaproteobacteria bacterium]|nr:hypothetical protein [Alphaproteobacteria bacterium]MCB9693305.1 hypothetical protein [Alphaproteobacteria bacterium]
MLTILAATGALAVTVPTVDCSADPAICATAQAAFDSVNAQVGFDIIDETSPSRLRPQTLFDSLAQLSTALGSNGCDISGWSAGQYQTRTKSWDGAYDDGTSGAWVGSYSPASRTFEGDWTNGTDNGAAGDVFSAYGSRKAAGNLNASEVVGGIWVRGTGANGIYVALHGSCSASDPSVFDPWFTGPFTTLSTGVTLRYTGDDSSRLWVDGTEIAAVPTNAGFEWSTLSTHLLDLTPGAHDIAIQVNDTGGGGVMMQFLAEDSSGGVLLSSTVRTDWASRLTAPTGTWQTDAPATGWSTPFLCGMPITAPWNGFTGTNTGLIWPHSACRATSGGTGYFRATLMVP